MDRAVDYSLHEWEGKPACAAAMTPPALASPGGSDASADTAAAAHGASASPPVAVAAAAPARAPAAAKAAGTAARPPRPAKRKSCTPAVRPAPAPVQQQPGPRLRRAATAPVPAAPRRRVRRRSGLEPGAAAAARAAPPALLACEESVADWLDEGEDEEGDEGKLRPVAAACVAPLTAPAAAHPPPHPPAVAEGLVVAGAAGHAPPPPTNPPSTPAVRAAWAALPPHALASAHGYGPVALSLGGSYFSRLAAACGELAAAAAACGCAHLARLASPGAAAAAAAAAAAGDGCSGGGDASRRPAFTFGPATGLAFPRAPGAQSPPLRARVAAIYFACAHVAAKNADAPPARRALGTMLAGLYGSATLPTPASTADLELQVLSGLGWRLGPFYGHEDF